MEKQTVFGSRQTLLVGKTLACLFGLTLLGLLFAPQKATMQNANKTITNAGVTANKIARMANAMAMPTPEPPKSTVRGRVFYEDTGRNVKRASIMLMGKDMRGREISALTDNDGNFEMKNVPAGTYYAFVNAPGVVSPLAFADISKPRSDGFDDAVENFPPIITDGLSDVFVQIPAKRGGAISGRVIYADGDPAIGVKVEVLRKVKDKFLAVIPNMSSMFSMMTGAAGGFQTDDRGVYRFAGLPAGEYVVKVTETASHGDNKMNSYNPFESLFGGGASLLTTYFPDAPDTKKAQIVNVALGLEQPEINITISDRNLFRVEGKVVAAKDKSPIKNAKVYLKRDNDDTFSIFDEIGKRQQLSTTDEQGNWTFKELPKGNFKIVVEPPNADYDEYGIYSNSNANVYMSNRAANTPPKPKLAKKTQTVAVEDKSLSNVVVELGYGATVTGMVVTENNAEMPTGGITVSIGKEADETGSSTTIYNYNEGALKTSQMNREFKLEGVSEGKTVFRVYTSDNDFYAKSVLFNGADLLANPINLKEGDNLKNVQIVLSKETGTVKGKVVNTDNQPAARAEFSLVPVDAEKRRNPSLFRNVKTGADGEFETKLAPGEYAVLFFGENKCETDGEECDRWLADAVKNAPKVTVKPNETEKLSLSLPK